MANINLKELRAESALSDATFSRVLTGGGTARSRKAVLDAARKLRMAIPAWLVPPADDSRSGGAE